MILTVGLGFGLAPGISPPTPRCLHLPWLLPRWRSLTPGHTWMLSLLSCAVVVTEQAEAMVLCAERGRHCSEKAVTPSS